jgi:stage V sporulation protein SpoVS
MRIYSSIVAIGLLVSALSTLAQPDYRCKIERVHNAAGEGKDSFVHQQRKTWIGKEFSVDRRTGAMSGALKNNHITRPEVIDAGSTDNAFKAVATMRREQSVGGGSVVFALIVNEYVDSSVKPFVFLSNDVTYFGSCLHER